MWFGSIHVPSRSIIPKRSASPSVASPAAAPPSSTAARSGARFSSLTSGPVPSNRQSRFVRIACTATPCSASARSRYPAPHPCRAGYLDRALAEHGVAVQAMRTNRDCLFDGTGPDVSEENLAPLRAAVLDGGAAAGLATDGDADRFGMIDRDGTWIQPNHILALVYDYIVETRGWNMPAARSVATSQLIDAAAKAHGQKTYQTPVGFKYIGQLIREDKIALGGEESAGLTIRGHVPEKDGILACLLVAEMIAARGASLGEQIRQLFKKVGRSFAPTRENLHLSDEQKASAIQKSKTDATTLIGRKVKSVDRTDGAKFAFDDGSWMLLRLSGTEPLLRLYVEAESPAASAKLVREATDWILKG